MKPPLDSTMADWSDKHHHVTLRRTMMTDK